jgi:2-amino-4-hydroxy-6-hydroxymethyldihydropteridine diphosphokinase
MNHFIISLGSNFDPEFHLQQALQELKGSFFILRQSSVRATKAVGTSWAGDYLNTVVLTQTHEPMETVKARLKAIELKMGRNRAQEKMDGRKVIDLDIVLWNEKIVDPHVEQYEFLKALIKEI